MPRSPLPACSQQRCPPGCAGDSGKAAVKLDPSNPTTITVWDYYNGAQQASFDSLVSEFNSTVGKEKGIYVKSKTQGSVPELEKAISNSAAGEVGAEEMPQRVLLLRRHDL